MEAALATLERRLLFSTLSQPAEQAAGDEWPAEAEHLAQAVELVAQGCFLVRAPPRWLADAG